MVYPPIPEAQNIGFARLKCNFGLHVYGKAPTTSENDLFFVFTISALISLVLSRFCRSKKYVRDIHQLDWKRQPSVGPSDHPGRQSDRGTTYKYISDFSAHLGSPAGPHPHDFNQHAVVVECLGSTADPGGHPDPPMVPFPIQLIYNSNIIFKAIESI